MLKAVCLVFAILTSILLFSCASPASGIGGDGGDVSVKQVPVGGSPFMGGGAGAGVAPGSTPQAAGATPAGSLTYSGSNSSSNSNGFYSEGLSSLGWTSLELDITANGTTTHHSVNPGNSIEFKNLAPGSTVTVTGTAVLPDGSTRNVKSDTYTVKKGENKLKLYCEYKYWRNGCYDTSCNGGPDTYMSNQSITLPVASDYTSGTNTYPFAGWIVYAPGLSTHGNYYRKGSNVPAGQVTGDVEFFADYGFALYKQTAGGTKTYIVPGAVQSVAAGGYLDLKAEDIAGNTVSITGVTITSGAGNAVLDSGKIKGVSAGTAVVRYSGKTLYGAPCEVDVTVQVVPFGISIDGGGSTASYTQTLNNAKEFEVKATVGGGVSLSGTESFLWTYSCTADTTTGIAAVTNQTFGSSTDTATFKPSLVGLYDTYTGTVTVKVICREGGVDKYEATATIDLTGFTLPAFKAVIDTSNVSDLAPKSGTTTPYYQDASGTPSAAFKAEASTAGVTLPSGADAVYTWSFTDPALKSGVSAPTGISTGALPLEATFGIGKYSDTSLHSTCNLSYHGKTKTSTACTMTIKGDAPAIKLAVTAGSGTTVAANGTTAYDITQTAENGAFTINVTKEDGTALPVGGSIAVTFVSNTNDYGVSTKPAALNTALKAYNVKDDFGLGVGDSATITLTATYTLNGIAKTAAVTTLNIKGTSTPAAGMYYYYSDRTVSSTKKTSETVTGIIVSASGTTARILDPTYYEAVAWCNSILGCRTDNETDGISAYNSWNGVLGINHNDYPVMNTAKTNRTSTGIDWFVPTVNELQTLYSLVSVIDPALTAMGVSKLTDTNWYWSSTTENGSNVKGVFFNAGFAGAASSYAPGTAKPFRLMADVTLAP